MNRQEAIDRIRDHERALRARGVTRLALFGSTARGEAREDSDVDVLVDIDPGRQFSLIDLAELRLFLSDMLGREVEVAERDHLKPLLRPAILAEAVDILR